MLHISIIAHQTLYKVAGLAAVVCHLIGDINHVNQRGDVNITLGYVIILSLLHVMSNNIQTHIRVFLRKSNAWLIKACTAKFVGAAILFPC